MKNELKRAIDDLLKHNIIPLNRFGAVGWVYDEKLWVVSKRFLFELSGFITDNKIQGLPTDKLKLMKVLYAEGLIVKSSDDSLVHKATVLIKEKDNHLTKLTLLCIPLKELYEDGSEDESNWLVQPDNLTIVESSAA